jgi:hypothetical protein
MSLQTKLSARDRSPLDLIGSYAEVTWSANNRMAKRQCDKCVYLVRGIAGPMVGLELVYDAIDGEHRHEAIYWVPSEAIQYLKVLSELAATHRIESFAAEGLEEDAPKD